MVRLINISENRGDLLQNLSYTYDAVGNITKIAQSAGPVNGLGGNYQNSYIYDDLNRLQHSFCKTGLFDYDFNITMSPTGRIGEKNLTYAAGAISSYQLNGYDRNFTTHQPRVIYDQVRGSQSLFWDANGNLSQTVDCKTGAASINFWDEENRLRLAVNPKFVGYYGYDANGERVYKLTGSTQYDDLNGSNPSFGIIFDGLTVYPSPYIVLTEKQYTKHYYAGTEKIATMIGDGGLLLAANHISNEQRSLIKDGFYRSFEPTAFQYEKTPNIDIEGKYQSQLEYACGYIDQANLYLMSNFPMLEPMMQIWQNSNGCRNEIYYTHGDHLGSANWITDADGKPIQYIHYAPYGELIANQQTIGYDERYKFTGKERDWETGYDYFGARFYWSADGIFTTVDPLADKYPNVTPYLYCNGNPIMLVDPDGREKKILVASGPHLETAEDEPDPSTALVIIAHGSFFGIKDEVHTGEECWTGNATKVADQILRQSETFKNDDIKDKLVILSCCNTGAKPTDAKGQPLRNVDGTLRKNFAQLLSMKLYNKLLEDKKEGQNVYVCAPTANVIAGSRKLFGLIRARAKGTERNMPWVIYKNGKEIDRFYIKGKNPTEEMIRQRIKNYENEHKTSTSKD